MKIKIILASGAENIQKEIDKWVKVESPKIIQVSPVTYCSNSYYSHIVSVLYEDNKILPD
jgi:hypothetical protein